ncbi:MAG: TIGR04282 family arsenosugar biosynthesis glycosyltransferase, partial [Paracoccaceae bacterium]
GWPGDLWRIPQGAGDLGARMRRAMDGLPPGPVVLIGSDIPDVRPAHIAQAFAALGGRDLVFGPAPDGGFWLVGHSRRRPAPWGFMRGVRWSSRHALADTQATWPGAKTAQVAALRDVDTAVDLI